MAASTSMHGTPFTNSIAVGTEATSHVWAALEQITETIILTRLVVAGTRPNHSNMLRRAVDGYTSATALANKLMIEGEMSFRTAHRVVGEIVREAMEGAGEPLEMAAAGKLQNYDVAYLADGLDPASIVSASVEGGGPSALSIRANEDSLRAEWHAQAECRRSLEQKWRGAADNLDDAVRQLCEAA